MRIETSNRTTETPAMSQEEFQDLGSNHVGYVRRVSPAFASGIIAEADETAPFEPVAKHGGKNEFWALYGANGQLLAIADQREDVLRLAVENQLIPLPRH